MVYEHIVPANPEVLDLDVDEIYIKLFTVPDIRRFTQISKIKGFQIKQYDWNAYIITYEQLKLLEERKIDYVIVAPE